MSGSKNLRSEILAYGVIAVLVVSIGFFLYDSLFSKAEHLQGILTEKIFVPASAVTGATPYGGVRRGNYSITTQKEEQWIAVVKMENGDTLHVHCHPGHYQTRNVGDVIHFKKYEGKLLHIKYFAHNEEED